MRSLLALTGNTPLGERSSVKQVAGKCVNFSLFFSIFFAFLCMCMWVKKNMCASCEAVRGDEAVRIRKEACVWCVRKDFTTGGLQYWWKRGLCENGIWEY